MPCGDRSSTTNYVCTLPTNHIEREQWHEHVATDIPYPTYRCTCAECIGSWLVETAMVYDHWDSFGEPADPYRFPERKAYINPPDVRTTKAARLP